MIAFGHFRLTTNLLTFNSITKHICKIVRLIGGQTTSKILHENQEYGNAIFLLQQGVEKLTKSYGLITKAIQPDGVKKISHNPKRVFEKQMEIQLEKFDNAASIEKIFPDLFKFQINDQEIDLTGYNEKFREASHSMTKLNPEDFLWISSEALDTIKSQINEIDTGIKINFEDFRKDFPELFMSIINQIESKTGSELIELKEFINNEIFPTTMEGILKEFIPMSLKIMKIHLSLFFFSLITSGHNQLSRYPCLCCGEIPKNNYTKEDVIVDRYDEIHEIMMMTVGLFDEIFIKKGASTQQSS
ncbi:MAG: hypothetical protein AAGI38_10220 [Bacteroidota bacterium]